MIGVAPLRLGIGTFQAMFSPVAVDHFSGSPVSVLWPVASGPRHWGQLSAESVTTAAASIVINTESFFTSISLRVMSCR